MTTELPAPGAGVALVPGELRGYRQFELRADGLYPLVHSASGPWDGTSQRARCAAGADHEAPARDCRCGLYAWYLPGSATVWLGPASAVILARGRCVLGDRGFRAAEARIEAVALPAGFRWSPWAASRARQMLSRQYPSARVYGSVRRMWRDHPPHDVRALGIDPPVDRTRRYRTALATTYAGGLLLMLTIATLPLLLVAASLQTWWFVLLGALALTWHAGLIFMIAQLLRLQSPGPPVSRAQPPSTGDGPPRH